MLRQLLILTASVVVIAAVLAVKASAYGSSENMLRIGEVAPEFSLLSQNDIPVRLTDFSGRYVVLYFYPKDRTPGCSLEAHNFERDAAKYAELNAVILGVSLDSVKSHKAFCTKDGLNFKLLADPDHTAIDAYKVSIVSLGPFKFAKRETFLIGPNGRLVQFWKVGDIQRHSDDVLRAIRNSSRSVQAEVF